MLLDCDQMFSQPLGLLCELIDFHCICLPISTDFHYFRILANATFIRCISWKKISWNWTITVRVWTWNCCWLVCTAEWKIAIITCAYSHVLGLGMHARRDSYRFVFALLFVRSLSPRLFMRFSTRQPGKHERPFRLFLRFRYGLSSCWLHLRC